MVQLTRIYTRGGDKGKTSLGSGVRVSKNDLRVCAYGTVDEANAILGLVRLHTQDPEDSDVDAMLQRIQNDLFDLGADLCMPESADKSDDPSLRIIQGQVDRLEREIDVMNDLLAPLKSFVLPGGCPAAAHLHMARTVVRRAEREMTQLSTEDSLGAPALAYINRLSDLLFVMARFVNARSGGDVLWAPGANR